MKQWKDKNCIHGVKIVSGSSKNNKTFVCAQCEQMARDKGHGEEVDKGEVFIYTSGTFEKK